MSKPQSAEQKAATSFLAVGAVPCQTFAPHYPEYYPDKYGETGKCLPDFYICINGKHVFFEFKDAPLNHKQSRKACRKSLQGQYKWRFDRDPGNMSHDSLSTALWRAEWYIDCLNHAYNHSLVKHLIIQKLLGRESYILVFEEEPSSKDAKYYNSKGLFWITLAQLPKFIH
ncbi:hypothetical protein RBA41_29570 [Massilia sp. CCM 9210]|uniref:hypothetical protein n=1 Tax=Massilia scottii TaxID=3057166 RepID=UPI0027965714|nr:hypothetical protein [Massilia sp. CCM 9210]MDQ1817462.1 hypothetical protein [Massilia sp. CCM 9210]